MRATLLVALFLIANNVFGQEAAFPLSPTEFRQRFNAVANKDGGDTIVNLKKEKGVYKAVLADVQFQKSVAAFKEMNLVNGKFVMQTEVNLRTNQAGNVTEIIVSSSRADPMNLIQGFVGTMGVVTKVLDPVLPQDQVTKLLTSLGLMRGDDDPTTGQITTQFSRGGSYGCLVRHSSVSVKVVCSVVPRS